MKRQAALYTLKLTNDEQTKLTLHDEPLLRFSNPVGGVPDGIAVMWKDGQRPAVFAQVFQTKEGLWIHECQSLAAAGLVMQRDDKAYWQPKEAAASFRKLADEPALADSPTRRLAQLRSLAQEFSATDDFKISSTDKETTRHTLRMLPRPVYRYQDPEHGIADAAVFAFVHGTDPELFLVLEHRTSKTEAGWHYALAPMTCWGVNAKQGEREVWSVPERLKSAADQDYHVWVYKP